MIKFTLYLILFFIASCAPRGEYKNIDSLLELSKKKYASSLVVETPVKSELLELSKNLEELPKNQKLSSDIAYSLRELINKAGYPSRPAISELILQYDLLAKDNLQLAKEANLKLIASRTFNLLAAELQTTAFTLS